MSMNYDHDRHDDKGGWGGKDDHGYKGGWGGDDNSTSIDDSFNRSDDDTNLLSGNQVLSGFQLTLIGDNDDNQGGGLLFWS